MKRIGISCKLTNLANLHDCMFDKQNMANSSMLHNNRRKSLLVFHPFHEFFRESLCCPYRNQCHRLLRSPEIRSTSHIQQRQFLRQPCNCQLVGSNMPTILRKFYITVNISMREFLENLVCNFSIILEIFSYLLQCWISRFKVTYQKHLPLIFLYLW